MDIFEEYEMQTRQQFTDMVTEIKKDFDLSFGKLRAVIAEKDAELDRLRKQIEELKS